MFVYTISLPPHNSRRFYWVGRKLRASTPCAAEQAKSKKISEWRPHQYLTEPSKWLFNVSVSMLQESCFSKYEWRRTDERNDEILLWLVIGQGLVAWHKHSAQTVEVKWSLASLGLFSRFVAICKRLKQLKQVRTCKRECRTITLYSMSTKVQKMGRTSFIKYSCHALLSGSLLILDPVFSLSTL